MVEHTATGKRTGEKAKQIPAPKVAVGVDGPMTTDNRVGEHEQDEREHQKVGDTLQRIASASSKPQKGVQRDREKRARILLRDSSWAPDTGVPADRRVPISVSMRPSSAGEERSRSLRERRRPGLAVPFARPRQALPVVPSTRFRSE